MQLCEDRILHYATEAVIIPLPLLQKQKRTKTTVKTNIPLTSEMGF